MATIKGRIKSLTVERGFGFIRASNGDEFFFHLTAVQGTTFDQLREGDDVVFQEVPSARGRRAANVALADGQGT